MKKKSPNRSRSKDQEPKVVGFLTAELDVTKEGRQEGRWCPVENPTCSQTVRRKEGSQTRTLRKLTCETPSSKSHSVPPKRYCKRGQRKVGIWEIELPPEERHQGASGQLCPQQQCAVCHCTASWLCTYPSALLCDIGPAP